MRTIGLINAELKSKCIVPGGIQDENLLIYLQSQGLVNDSVSPEELENVLLTKRMLKPLVYSAATLGALGSAKK